MYLYSLNKEMMSVNQDNFKQLSLLLCFNQIITD